MCKLNLTLKVTELAVDIVAPVASVCPVKNVPATLEAIIMSAPLELTNWRFPSVLADATISPIAALFIAVIVDDNVFALEKLIAFPLILIFDAAEEAWELFTVIVTKLFPDAVTLVVEEIALIETAFAAAELVDAPTAVSFIFISWDAVNAFVETKSELICVFESTSLKPNLAKSSIFPWLLVYPLARVLAQFSQMYHHYFQVLSNPNMFQM